MLIDTPPPTISGNLHMGHAYSYLLIDFYRRYEQGYIEMPIGFDCNGVPTEKLAEKHKTKPTEDFVQSYIDGFKDVFAALDIDQFAFEYRTDSKQCLDIANNNLNRLLAGGLAYKKDNEYFVKTLENKEKILLYSKDIKIYPESMRVKLEQWIQGLDRDWSISRERDFGVRILDENLVYDTWFISAATPMFFQKRPHVRFHGYDIIRSWTFYTLALFCLLEEELPFHKLAVNGFCLDANGKKMSKSVGNIVTPSSILEKWDSDCIRYWAASNKLGNDIKICETKLKEGKRLFTKLYNVAKYCKIQKSDGVDFKEKAIGFLEKKEPSFDNFYLFITEYNFAEALNYINGIFWNDFLNFLEKSKEQCYAGCEKSKGRLEIYFSLILSCYEIFFPKIANKCRQTMDS